MDAAIVGTAEHYAQFVQLCRQRIEELGITFATVDEICGFPDRYTAILLSGGRRMSAFSFFALARGLALLPQFAHDAAQLERLRSRSGWIKTRRPGPRWRLSPAKRRRKRPDLSKVPPLSLGG